MKTDANLQQNQVRVRFRNDASDNSASKQLEQKQFSKDVKDEYVKLYGYKTHKEHK
ncbi:hypothetical protein [Ferrimonas balearica]|uniref:hypothetical protein n=1 Tax=Ferrimonas balearica TaxID=44012 RepID=UPI001C5A1A29|nr:hypothetical protein [Ferrimonas balearica]MBW3165518.1 hypothetical protein [Ferrimonas balearica]